MPVDILEQGEGILRLAPTWVPRGTNPGKRLKLHPSDLHAYGPNRGAIIERWLASTTKANNGPLTTADEGLSYVIYSDEGKLQHTLLKDLIDESGSEIIGEDLWNKYHRWPAFAKFFDNKGPLPLHLHHKSEHAALVATQTKPESYFFPPQLNQFSGDFPYTFFGLEPGTTQKQILNFLDCWKHGEAARSIQILDFSRAYKLEIGTGWYVKPGVLHAPGSFCTYEPQWASDIGIGFQSIYNEIPVDWKAISRNLPEGKQDDIDFILSMLDWEANTAVDFKDRYFRRPVPARPLEEMQATGYIENWISYGNPHFSAQELTVFPGRSVVIKDSGPYGMVMVQGHGHLGHWPIETPALIRFGQLTNDEFFISFSAAQEGVRVTNESTTDPLVMLKHFGPNPESP